METPTLPTSYLSLLIRCALNLSGVSAASANHIGWVGPARCVRGWQLGRRLVRAFTATGIRAECGEMVSGIGQIAAVGGLLPARIGSRAVGIGCLAVRVGSGDTGGGDW